MSVIFEKLPVLKYIAEISIQTIVDWMTFLFLTGWVTLFYWAMTCIFWIPLFIFLIPQIGILVLLYSCWIYYDRNTARTGGRKSKWFCNLSVHNLTRNYFSNRLIKTADLPVGRNYVLAHYPHGILPFNIISNFIHPGNKVADLFPGIEMHYVTADLGFFLPILRDFLLVSGGCSCAESSFSYLLKSPPSKGVVVVPGGASEVKYIRSDGIYTIIKRKGFVRLALATGTPMVPVFTFGEVNAFTKVYVLPIWKSLEKFVRDTFKCSSDAYVAIGRGLLPKKVPVNTIVGAPISVPKVENPSKELIDEYCDIFFQALQDLFEQYKHEYDIAGEKAKLIVIQDSHEESKNLSSNINYINNASPKI